jgi:hypothetical protein
MFINLYLGDRILHKNQTDAYGMLEQKNVDSPGQAREAAVESTILPGSWTRIKLQKLRAFVSANHQALSPNSSGTSKL